MRPLRALAPLLLGGCASLVSFQPHYATFEGRFIDRAPAQIEVAAGPAPRPTEVRALTDSGPRAFELLQLDGIVHAPAFQQYLEDTLRRVLDAYPYPGRKDIRILIEASDRPNAFSTPQGEIYVSLGMLERLESESQLAALLAHEAAHVQLDHFKRQEYFDTQREAVVTGAGVGILAFVTASTRVRKAGDRYEWYNRDAVETQENITELMLAAWLVNLVSDDVLNTHWTRDQEQQADLLAVDLTVASGYDPRGAAGLMRVLAAIEEERGTLLQHAERELDRINAELTDLDDPIAALGALPGRLGGVIGSVAAEAWRRLGATHPKAADRQTWAVAYTEREYAEVPFGRNERRADGVRYLDAQNLRLPPETRRGHKAAQRAKHLLNEGRLAEAEQQGRVAISGPTAHSAHTRTVMYEIRKALGRHDEALADLELIGRDELRPKRTFSYQAAEYANRNRYREALEVLRRGAQQFGTEEPFLPPMVAVHAMSNDVPGAVAAHERCREVDSEEIRVECDRAIAPLELEDLEPASRPDPFDSLRQVLTGQGA